MKKLAIIAALSVAAIAQPAHAMTYYLVNSWISESGSRMCQYGNGTVLNMGIKLCPMSIQG